MANKSRQSANLVSDTNLYVDVTNNMVGIGTTIPTSKLNVVGDVLVSGVVTATSFVGSVTGTATTATNLSDAANITAGTISSSRLSGSYGINITGTATTATTAGYANTAGISTVSQGLTGTPNITVGVVTATSFVKSSGTSSQFLKADGSVDSNTYLTSESDTFYTVTNRGNTSAAGINVSGDLYVSGNISFGGTTTQLNLKQLEIVDADIVLGIGTSFSPTDTTANHGGIAIASTEGTPLVSLKIAPGETNPDTYKKIMWFKSNEAGLGTDAWLANYAVGIGSTQFPNGTRLAAGNVQFTQNDLTVIRNISASGIITATSGFTGNLTGTATTATTAGYANTSGISTVSQGLTGTPNIVVGIATATTLNVGTVGIKTITTVTDITAADYQGKSKSVTTDDGTPQAVYVGAAGTAMFIVGSTNDRVIQYTLSTPYDVSTAGAAVTFFSNATQETNATGIDFNTTGTKMFLSGNTGGSSLIVGGDYIHEYSLSTAWNVAPSSVGWTTSYNVTQDSDPQAVAFGSSGSKMYVVGNTNNAIYQYSLSTPYSLASGVTYDSKSLAVGTLVGETSPTDISFNSTGTVLWVLGATNDRIYEFRLGTAWDISTAVFYDDVFVAFNEGGPTGLQVLPNENVLYVVGTVNDTVYQYALNSPALQISASGINTASSIILNNETRIKDKLYVKGNTIIDGTLIAQGSSAVEGNLTVSGGTITAGNVAASLLGGNTTTNITFANIQTTGTLTVGGSAQTGAITLGLSTTSQTTNIQSGISTSGTQKTINIGTGGASGSNTLITLGSATAGAISTVTIPNGNVGIGTTKPGSRLHIGGGTTVAGTAPLEIASGSLLTSIESDVFEYDGVNLYHTDNNTTSGNGRALIPEVRYRRLTTTNANVGVAATNPFGVGVGSFSVLANELYELEAIFYLTKNTSNGALTYSFNVSTGSFVSLGAMAHPIVGITNAETVAGRGVSGATANNTQITTASLTQPRSFISRVTATFIPTANCFFTLQMLNAAATTSILPDSYMKLVGLGNTIFTGNVT